MVLFSIYLACLAQTSSGFCLLSEGRFALTLCKFDAITEVISEGGGHDAGMSNVTQYSGISKTAAASPIYKSPSAARTAASRLRIPTAAPSVTGIKNKSSASSINKQVDQDNNKKVEIVEMQQNVERVSYSIKGKPLVSLQLSLCTCAVRFAITKI